MPAWLRHLRDQPLDLAHFNDDWPELCSEGTTWSAAYAAMPHLVEMASRVPPTDRFDYVVVFGLIVKDQVQCDPEDPMGLRPYLASGFKASIEPALRLAAEALGVVQPGERELRYALMAVASLQGYPMLAECIDRLDDPELCPFYAESSGPTKAGLERLTTGWHMDRWFCSPNGATVNSPGWSSGTPGRPRPPNGLAPARRKPLKFRGFRAVPGRESRPSRIPGVCTPGY
ncbi:MAG: hypothetical protein U0800_07470 [Isosphaeraceae bacterium]